MKINVQQVAELEKKIKAKLSTIADRNHDGRVDKQDISWAVSHAVQAAVTETASHPKLAIIITAVVSTGITSMLWALFCN